MVVGPYKSTRRPRRSNPNPAAASITTAPAYAAGGTGTALGWPPGVSPPGPGVWPSLPLGSPPPDPPGSPPVPSVDWSGGAGGSVWRVSREKSISIELPGKFGAGRTAWRCTVSAPSASSSTGTGSVTTLADDTAPGDEMPVNRAVATGTPSRDRATVPG